MLKNPDRPIVGWLLFPHGPSWAPPVREAMSRIRNDSPYTDWEKNKGKESLDDFALAIYLKIAMAAAMNPRGYMVFEAGIDTHVRPFVALSSFIKLVLEELRHQADVKRVRDVDGREFKRTILRAQESGERFFVRYKGVPYYVTRVRFWPRFAFADIYGLAPSPREVGEWWLGVAIPLVLFMQLDQLPYEEVPDQEITHNYSIYPLRKPIIPYFNLFSVPSFTTSDVVDIGNVLQMAKLAFPPLYFEAPVDPIPSYLTVVTAGCPILLRSSSAYRYAKTIYEKYRAISDLSDAELRLAEEVYNMCQKAGPENTVIASASLNTITAYRYDVYLSAPLINAFAWTHRRHRETPFGKSVSTVERVYREINVSRANPSGKFIAAETVQWWTAWMNYSINTIDSTEDMKEYKTYATTVLYPGEMLGDDRAELFPMVISPVTYTYSKHNVHPSNPLLFAYNTNGHITFIHQITFDELVKVATYLFYEDEKKAMEDKRPPDIEDMGFDYERMKPYMNKLFIEREVRFTKFLELIYTDHEGILGNIWSLLVEEGPFYLSLAKSAFEEVAEGSKDILQLAAPSVPHKKLFEVLNSWQ